MIQSYTQYNDDIWAATLLAIGFKITASSIDFYFFYIHYSYYFYLLLWSQFNCIGNFIILAWIELLKNEKWFFLSFRL